MVIHSLLDDGALSGILIWMPAHISEAMVGQSKCSNGQRVSVDMFAANSLSDFLAKKGAETVRLTSTERRKLKQKLSRHKELAVFVGRMTHAANHHELEV